MLYNLLFFWFRNTAEQLDSVLQLGALLFLTTKRYAGLLLFNDKESSEISMVVSCLNMSFPLTHYCTFEVLNHQHNRVTNNKKYFLLSLKHKLTVYKLPRTPYIETVSNKFKAERRLAHTVAKCTLSQFFKWL